MSENIFFGAFLLMIQIYYVNFRKKFLARNANK